MYGLEGILGNLITSVATPAIGGMTGEFFGSMVGDEVEKQLLKEITQTTTGALSGAAVGAGLGALTGGGGAGALSGALTGGVGGGLGGYNAQDISQMFGGQQSVVPSQASRGDVTEQLLQGTDFNPQQTLVPPAGGVGPGAPGGGYMGMSQDTLSAIKDLGGAPPSGPVTQNMVNTQRPLETAGATASTTQPSAFKGYVDFLKKNYEPLAGGFFLGSAIGANQDTEEQAKQYKQSQLIKDYVEHQNALALARSMYGYADGGYVERPSDALIKKLLETGPSIYGSQEHNLEKRPLNVQNLIDAGAMRITYPGDGTGSYDPNLEGYSIVSRINDVGDSMTRGWPDKPDSYKDAARSLSDPKMLSQLSDAKYKQLIDSAAAAGLTDKDMYSGYADGGPVEVGISQPEINVHFPAWAQEQIQREGGLAALQPEMRQGLANGGYINTQQVNPENFYPQSQMPKAQPYAAASPIRHEVINNFAHGGLIDGPGDGMSDSIPANISGKEPVKVADGEYVVPKELAHKYGPEKLKHMMAKVRAAAHAKKGKQIVQGAAQRAFISSLSGIKA